MLEVQPNSAREHNSPALFFVRIVLLFPFPAQFLYNVKNRHP